jgi:hypothetical protein
VRIEKVSKEVEELLKVASQGVDFVDSLVL